jgi:predicted ATP-dependent endonuclease of OLD family
MQHIELDNFRVFGTPASFDLAPVTVLTGKNNSGKSSLIKAFLVLADYLEQDDQTVLRLDGPRAMRHKISSFDHLQNWARTDSTVVFSYKVGLYEFEYAFTLFAGGNLATLSRFSLRSGSVEGSLILEHQPAAQLCYRVVTQQSMIDFVSGEELFLAEQAKHFSMLATKKRQQLTKDEAFYEEMKLRFERSPEQLQHQAVATNFTERGQRLHELRERIKQAEENAATCKTVDTGLTYRATLVVDEQLRNRLTVAYLVQQALIQFVKADADSENRQQELKHEAQLRKLVSFEQELTQLLHFTSVHLGPNRTYQSRLFFNQQTGSEITAIVGAFVHKGVARGSAADTFLRYWLPVFGVGTSVDVQPVEGMAFKIVVDRPPYLQPTNLADLGFGAGQILTILLQIASVIQLQHERRGSSRNTGPTLLLIEEPEANLHPKLQSQLAQLFMETARDHQLVFLLETHSEYLIRKMQLLVASGSYLPEGVAIHYLDQPTSRRIDILSDGKLSEDFGPGFFDEADDNALELFRLQKKAARTQPTAV